MSEQNDLQPFDFGDHDVKGEPQADAADPFADNLRHELKFASGDMHMFPLNLAPDVAYGAVTLQCTGIEETGENAWIQLTISTRAGFDIVAGIFMRDYTQNDISRLTAWRALLIDMDERLKEVGR